MRSLPRELLLVLGLSAATAAAQTRVVPQSYVWQPQAGTASNDPKFVGMARYPAWQRVGGLPVDISPVTCAQQIAAQVIEAKLAGRLANNTVCINIKNFGEGAEPSLTTGISPRLYTVDDEVEGVAFPVPGSDATAYRHPLLLNGAYDPQGGPETYSPLREWMRAFVREMQRQWELNVDLMPYPGAYRYYFDNEVRIAWDNANGMAMFGGLAASPRWTTVPVPGWGASKTMADLYADERNAQPEGAWPASILDQSDGIQFGQPGLNAGVGRNPKFYAWYERICETAKDGILARCAYDVFTQPHGTPGQPGYFPGWGSSVKFGNYDSARFDGLMGTSQWYYDLHGTGPGVLWIPGQPAPSIFSPANLSNVFPRVFMPRKTSTILLERYNLRNNGSHDRGLGYSLWSSGTADSPALYPLIQGLLFADLDGHPTNPRQRGYRQLNPFVPPEQQYPLVITVSAGRESAAYSNLRLQRERAEGIINSSEGRHEERLSPWVAQNIVYTDGQLVPPHPFYTSGRLLRTTLAMLRGKNVRELLWFTSSGDQRVWRSAWLDSRSAIRGVYSTEVKTVTAIVGGSPSANINPAALEFTLDVPEAPAPPQQREPYAATVGSLDHNGENVTELEVVFQVNSAYRARPFEVYVECVADAGVIGSAFAFDWRSMEWDKLRLIESEPGPSPITEYAFLTPDHRAHRTFVFDAPTRAGSPGSNGIYIRNNELLVRLVHRRAGVPGFVSKYDLVQAIPANFIFAVDPPPLEQPEPGSPPALDAEACRPATGGSNPIPTFLNSDFCRLRPPCSGSETTPCDTITLAFTRPVCAVDPDLEASPPVHVKKVGAAEPYNYAAVMNIGVKSIADAGWSQELVLSGNGTTLMVPGVYEVTPVDEDGAAVTGGGGSVIASPMWDRTYLAARSNYDPDDPATDWWPQPLTTPFVYQFELLPDCDLDGVNDAEEIDADPTLDIYPVTFTGGGGYTLGDGRLDACAENEECTGWADVNDDGNINQDDVDCMISMVAGGTCSPWPPVALDTNQDGLLTQDDVNRVIAWVAGGCE